MKLPIPGELVTLAFKDDFYPYVDDFYPYVLIHPRINSIGNADPTNVKVPSGTRAIIIATRAPVGSRWFEVITLQANSFKGWVAIESIKEPYR